MLNIILIKPNCIWLCYNAIIYQIECMITLSDVMIYCSVRSLKCLYFCRTELYKKAPCQQKYNYDFKNVDQFFVLRSKFEHNPTIWCTVIRSNVSSLTESESLKLWCNKMLGMLLFTMKLIQTLTSHLKTWPGQEHNLKTQRT